MQGVGVFMKKALLIARKKVFGLFSSFVFLAEARLRRGRFLGVERGWLQAKQER